MPDQIKLMIIALFRMVSNKGDLLVYLAICINYALTNYKIIKRDLK